MKIYYSRDDNEYFWKITLSKSIQTIIHQTNDLFRLCGFDNLDGFFLKEENILMIHSNGTYLGVLKISDLIELKIENLTNFPHDLKLSVKLKNENE